MTITDTINLSNLTDIQKSFLTQLSYLDINHFGMRKCKNVGIKVKDLAPFLSNPDLPFCGSATMSKSAFDQTTTVALGDYKMPTDAELLECIKSLGLGDLVIVDVVSDAKSGFQATAIKDFFGNIGISFRGSDLDFSRGGIMDWIEADFLEYFTNDSRQRKQAIEFFDTNKNTEGNNYIYGHSLGGNLASHVYVENYNEIAGVFTINGYPINQKLINTPEKIAAFNSKKHCFNSICGDIVSHLKSCKLYQDNVRFVKNNERIKPSLMSAHLVQSAEYDENGNFVETTREEMTRKISKIQNDFVTVAQNIRESLNELDARVESTKIGNHEILHKNQDKDEIGRVHDLSEARDR